MRFSSDKRHIVVTYHYVENPSDEKKGIHPCSIEELERQIAFLSKHYKIASVAEVFEEARKGGDEAYCAITFDDGLRDQYKNALPILKKFNILATFFIITNTLRKKIPVTHKVHILLSHTNARELIEKFNAFLTNQFPNESQYRIPTDRPISTKRRHESDICIANFKEMFAKLPEKIPDMFLEWIFNEYSLDENQLASELFMNEDEIGKLSQSGFDIGNHTHQHRAFDSTSPKDIQVDVETAQKYLGGILGLPPTIFCYPYGRVGKNPADTARVLEKEGITHAVTVEPRALNTDDKALAIPRFDTNDIRDFLNHDV